MKKGTKVSIAGVLLFSIIAISLISLHPIKIFVLGIGVSLYLLGKKINKGK